MESCLIFVKIRLFTLFLLFVYRVNGHPQCLDSRPPFQISGGLSFCSEYQQFGCCTQYDDDVLMQRYNRIRNSVPASEQIFWENCAEYARSFLCQTCSPYAAHIFDAEQNQNQYDNNIVTRRAFPGLCKNHCSTFYKTCKDLVAYYMNEAGSSHEEERTKLANAVSQGETQFCTAISLSDNDYCFPELLTNPILNGNISIDKVTQEGCICMQAYNELKLRNPIFLKNANDGSNRLFVGEQLGLIHVMYPNGTILPTPFIDISYDVKTTQSKGDERGLLGMEFHPNFTTNGKLYVYYSTPLSAYEKTQDLGDHKVRIEELKVHPSKPNEVDLSYSRVILEVYEPWWNHNGGEILFGDDGYLYLFVGDGGKAGDPLNSGQDMFSMLGKVHRIDVNRVDVDRQKEYGIPPDNPFADGINGLPEIYAFGVRNIWRCGKDRGDPVTGYGKGRIICGDVGQGAVEELNLLQKGANYGWKLKEGTADYCTQCPQALPNISLTDPIHDYPHSVGKSVTGGHFYRGCQSPNFNGFYIYGDFMSGRLFRLTEPTDPNQYRWNNKELKMCGSDWCKPPLTNEYSTSIISFGEDEDGEIYMLSTSYASTASFSGTIYRLVDPNRRGNPENCKSRQNQSKSSPETSPVTNPTAKSTPKAPEPSTNQQVPQSTNKSGKGEDTSSANIVAPGDERMANYLNYFKKNRRRKSRRKSRKPFQEKWWSRPEQESTYRTAASTSSLQRDSTLNLVFHGINVYVHRCENTPSYWCTLRRVRK